MTNAGLVLTSNSLVLSLNTYISKQSGTKSVIDVADKPTAIQKGDMELFRFTPFRKPTKWTHKMRKCIYNVEPIGLTVVYQLAKEELQIDVVGECNKADSVSKLTEQPVRILEVLNTLSLAVQFQCAQQNVKSRCSALMGFLKQGE